jgi:GT2 family glycosyltransferase
MARPKGSPTLSVIVPSYNARALTQECVAALAASIRHRNDIEIIVSDDGSTDGTSEGLEATGVAVVRSETNRGFSAACNAGAAIASGKSLVFYNNDLIPHEGWADELIEYVRQVPHVAAVGSKLLFPDGRVQHAGVTVCSDGYPRHIYAGFPADHPVVNRSGPVRLVTGACMLVARTWFDRMGGFDEGYRNGYEDTDLCLRIGEAHGEVHYCHRSVLVHLVSATREHRSEEFAATQRRFWERWGHLPPEDLSWYVRDGLVKIEYRETFPAHVWISPLLAVLGSQDVDERSKYAVLTEQLYEARRENVRLRLRIVELERTPDELHGQHSRGHGRKLF